MSTKYETFSYSPIELAESMTGTVHDTLIYLVNRQYISEADFEYLMSTTAVYALPNRKGFGSRLLGRIFGKDENENSFIFPIVEIDPERHYKADKKTNGKPTLNVVKGKFDNKDKVDE